MPNLQRIQDRIDILSEFIDELAEANVPSEVQAIKEKTDKWKEDTDSILNQEFTDYSPELEDFHTRWKYPLRGSNAKVSLARRLRNARTDLRHYIREIQREETFADRKQTTQPQPELVLTDYGVQVCEQYWVEPDPKYFRR